MRHAIYHFDTCQFVLPKMERMKDDVQIMRIQMGSLLIAYRNRRCARKKVKKWQDPTTKRRDVTNLFMWKDAWQIGRCWNSKWQNEPDRNSPKANRSQCSYCQRVNKTDACYYRRAFSFSMVSKVLILRHPHKELHAFISIFFNHVFFG